MHVHVLCISVVHVHVHVQYLFYISLDMYYCSIIHQIIKLYLSYLQHDELSFQEGDTLYILEKVTSSFVKMYHYMYIKPGSSVGRASVWSTVCVGSNPT